MLLTPLSDQVLKSLVETALYEDLSNASDITTNAVVAKDSKSEASLNARQEGVIAGLDLARLSFQTLDPSLELIFEKKDGDHVRPGDCLMRIRGSTRPIFSAERVALNFSCHLSGIATATWQCVEAVKPYKTRICCTRKTTPGLRVIEKYAVRAGGGINHRFGLYDAVLIKDNHVASAGGVSVAIANVRKSLGEGVKIEIEVDTLAQLDEILASPFTIHTVLLDNMKEEQLKQAVDKVGQRFTTEASGGITLKNIKTMAATGVDVISLGWITHSAPILDLGLDMSS